ncbi:MAG: thymidine phosphorylase [Ruminococcaceae bacterium]|nr:thymidine phosphorylase [Oscillospiraceae bacterium]
MTIYSIIEKKRDGQTLSDAEIAFFVRGVTDGSIADYQTAALLMAIFIRGMTREETLALTLEMSRSGDSMPFAPTLVDKHSTGGCGDTTTLVLLPLCMAAGAKIAKTSGRSLGHTGGTIDKLEAIPGFRTTLSPEEFAHNLATVGAALSAQTANIAPADKTLYALRDVTATVDSLPLIAASIMSKKLATGTGRIVLDVKCGSGAFMRTEADALALARLMVDIGRRAGRDTRALITRMDAPLGDAVGNALEVMEAIAVLKGKQGRLRKVVLSLATHMTGKSVPELEALLDGGAALEAFGRFIAAQGGDTRVLSDFSLFKQPLYHRVITLSSEGFICGMDAAAIGTAALLLGAGRTRKEDAIDFSAGILMHKTIGDTADGSLCTLYTDAPDMLDTAEAHIRRAIQTGKEKMPERDIIIDTVE